MTMYAMCAELGDITSYGGTLGGSISEDTTASFRRAANARTSIRLNATGSEDTLFFTKALAGTQNEFWTRFVFNSASSLATDRRFFKFYAGGTQRLSLASGGGNSARVQKYSGGAWATLQTTGDVAFTAGTRHIIDVFVKLGNPGTLKVYLNEVPVISETGLDLTWAGVAGFDELRFQSANTVNVTAFSEIIAADWITLGGKLVSNSASGAGAYSEWAGGFAVINETPPANNYALSGTAGQRLSFVKPAIAALAAGESIEAVSIGSLALRDSAGPQHFNHFIRIAGTDYHKADQNPVVAIAAYQDMWEKSPATGLTWAVSEINAAEPGIRSRT